MSMVPLRRMRTSAMIQQPMNLATMDVATNGARGTSDGGKLGVG